jgi:hypothetical protein
VLVVRDELLERVLRDRRLLLREEARAALVRPRRRGKSARSIASGQHRHDSSPWTATSAR